MFYISEENMIKKQITLNKYIEELLQNQNKTNISSLQNLVSKDEYREILSPVLNIMRMYPDLNFSNIKEELFYKSSLKKLICDLVNKKELTPGMVMEFGTRKNREQIIIGQAQEPVITEDSFTLSPIEMSESTIFSLASTSKIYTVLAIMILEEQGLINLFDSITKYAPEFKNLSNVTIYDLLKFRVKIETPIRIDSAKNEKEAENILFASYVNENNPSVYTDIGAMILRYVIENTSGLSLKDFIYNNIIKKAHLENTYLNVPLEKLKNVASNNYSGIIDENGKLIIEQDNYPGTVHDPKAKKIGVKDGIAPGHAGYYASCDDMLKLVDYLLDEKIITKESISTLSENESELNNCFFGSLVFLKQLDPNVQGIFHPLSGQSFLSPGYEGTALYVDPLNELSLFIGANRLHNRIHKVHPSQTNRIITEPNGKQIIILPNGQEKIVSSKYAKEKDKIADEAFRLSLQYALLEKHYPNEKGQTRTRKLG